MFTGGWQVRLGQGFPGDGLGVGLGPASAAAPLRGAVRMDFTYVLAGRGLRQGHRPRKADPSTPTFYRINNGANRYDSVYAPMSVDASTK